MKYIINNKDYSNEIKSLTNSIESIFEINTVFLNKIKLNYEI